jgi:hypothetical protein
MKLRRIEVNFRRNEISFVRGIVTEITIKNTFKLTIKRLALISRLLSGRDNRRFSVSRTGWVYFI